MPHAQSHVRFPRSLRRALVWAALPAFVACTREPPLAVGAPDAATTSTAARTEDAAREDSPSQEDEARALITAWEAAQDASDFTRYEALYAAHFTGVRRSGPRTRNFDRRGWLEDRARMFKGALAVDFKVEQLADQGATISVLGTQSFRSAGYEDRGQKSFLLAREGGALRIVREEMLASELGPAPTIAARMVVDIADGPVLAIVGRASSGLPRGARVSVHASYPAAAVYAADALGVPADVRSMLEGPVQLVGPEGTCSTRARAARLVHVSYAHSGQVAQWRGEDANTPKPTPDALAEQIRVFDPEGFWAVELADRCVRDALVAVPGERAITVFAKAELAERERRAVVERFKKLSFVRALTEEERAQTLADLTITRFSAGAQVLLSAESIGGCSAPVVHALFDESHGGKLGFGGDQGGAEHVEAVADLDGDGQPEVIARSAIGADTWGVVDVSGKERIVLRIPYFDCPC